MGVDHTPLSAARTIELLQQFAPHVEDLGALFGLLFHQSELTLDAQTVADAYAGVADGKPLPRLGLSHHGVQLAVEFDADDWARVRAPLERVARGDLPHVARFVTESARRMLAVEQIIRLDAGRAAVLLALIDPTVPPPLPEVFAALMAEHGVTFGGARGLMQAVEDAPRARPFVIGVIDAFKRVS